jgi:hypothetical protein
MATDFRDRVEEDRGWIKKIQMHIPGFAGYRTREDIRAADSMLRIEMAKLLSDVRMKLEGERTHLSEKYLMDYLWRLGKTLTKMRTTEGKLRHAAQGYSGISPPIRIKEDNLDQLYEYDEGMLKKVKEMKEMLQDFNYAIEGYNDDIIKEMMKKFDEDADTLDAYFEKRHQIMMNSPME